MPLVASYNIRKAIGSDRRRRPERILEVLAELDADIIALQEADRRFGARQSAIPPHMLSEHSDYRPVPFDIRAGSIGWHGNALLVRDTVTILRHMPLVLPALEPRGAVLADLRIGGHELRVVGMHLDLSGLWRRRQARAILSHIEQQPTKLPTILMGDLNEWTASSGCLHDFAAHYKIAHIGPSFHARRPIARLDRILTGDGISVEEAGVHRSLIAQTASDHLPVWARVHLHR
ncbi:endonuclease [Sphingomonas oleivorans]|uniref:Endonuclease n=1 Tax=Sphingomonas oleivorans TaxID=1735121 RepID=A0A2T5FWR3_9SPHN|nr:endonuclease/exonuclease/phosphatase family protein [Sphingomonas oleivorans]PTQ10230.1 endonuclease [Sphingomonas oleivorans]